MMQNPFMIDFAQNEEQQNPLSGLAGLLKQYEAMQGSEQPNSFAAQTPGAPQQPGRIDQSSFASQGGGDEDPLSILSSLIAKRFGG